MSVFTRRGFYQGDVTGVVIYVGDDDVGTTNAKVIELNGWEGGEVGEVQSTWNADRFYYPSEAVQNSLQRFHERLITSSSISETQRDNRVFYRDLCGADQTRRAAEKLHGLNMRENSRGMSFDLSGRDWEELIVRGLLPNLGHLMYEEGRKVLWFDSDSRCLFEGTIVEKVDSECDVFLSLDRVLWDDEEEQWLIGERLSSDAQDRLSAYRCTPGTYKYVPVWDVYPTEGFVTSCEFVRYNDEVIQRKVFRSAYKYGLSKFYEKFEKKEAEDERYI